MFELYLLRKAFLPYFFHSFQVFSQLCVELIGYLVIVLSFFVIEFPIEKVFGDSMPKRILNAFIYLWALFLCKFPSSFIGIDSQNLTYYVSKPPTDSLYGPECKWYSSSPINIRILYPQNMGEVIFVIDDKNFCLEINEARMEIRNYHAEEEDILNFKI